MYVKVRWSDGIYSMVPCEYASEYKHPNAIEISDEMWKEYEFFLDLCQRWHKIIGKLDNEIYERNEKAGQCVHNVKHTDYCRACAKGE